jgi:predicted ATP-grasp superfamily ATP-dependent carboligase
VHVTSVAGRSLAAASRFCDAEHRVPDPMQDAPAFTHAVFDLVDRLGADVLLPMTDVSAAVVLSSGLGRQRPGLVIPFPAEEVWSTVSDKRALLDVARTIGVPVPAQIVVERRDHDFAAAIDWAAASGFPVVLKPHRSAAITANGVRKLGVAIADSEEQMRSRLEAFDAAAYPVLVQERIEGPGLGGFFLAVDGEVVTRFAHRRLREKPPTGGVSVLRESAPLAQAILLHSEALLRHFAWTGVAMIEFKQDARTGIPYLMEINGRFWGSLQLAIDSGVDFPRQLMDIFLNPDPSAQRRTSAQRSSAHPYELGVRSRWLWGDVDHLLWILRAPRGYRTRDASLPSRLGALGRFLLPWTPGQRLEVLRISDPRPFLRESRDWFRSLGR